MLPVEIECFFVDRLFLALRKVSDCFEIEVSNNLLMPRFFCRLPKLGGFLLNLFERRDPDLELMSTIESSVSMNLRFFDRFRLRTGSFQSDRFTICSQSMQHNPLLRSRVVTL